MLSAELAALYTRDLTRLVQELEAFPDTETLWQTRAGITNSAGNLALHLEGNLRQFIGRLLGQLDYTRDRPSSAIQGSRRATWSPGCRRCGMRFHR